MKNYNVFIMALAFMLVFTGFNTMSGIQTLIFKSATTEGSGGFVKGFEVIETFSSSSSLYWSCLMIQIPSHFFCPG